MDTDINIKVFIDTNAYEGLSYDFQNNIVLKKLIDLHQQPIHPISILTCNIVIEESIKHIEDAGNKLLSDLSKTLNDKTKRIPCEVCQTKPGKSDQIRHENRQKELFKNLFKDETEEIRNIIANKRNIVEEKTQSIRQIFNTFETIDKNINEIRGGEILHQYFTQKPPFQDGRKKAEFPNAFILIGLNHYINNIISKQKENEKYVFVIISKDKSFHEFFKKNCKYEETISIKNDIREFVDDHEKAYQQGVKVMEAVEGLKESLNKNILESYSFDNVTISDEYPLPAFPEIYDILNESIKNLSIDNLVSIEGNSATFEFLYDLSFSVEVHGKDPDTYSSGFGGYVLDTEVLYDVEFLGLRGSVDILIDKDFHQISDIIIYDEDLYVSNENIVRAEAITNSDDH
ncbi:MAG: hypothetical protein CMF61_04310 [Magnetococcales bacterium]|nr:hypothetical protein [Magnetococcales bacterium]